MKISYRVKRRVKLQEKILGLTCSIVASAACYTVAFLGAAGGVPFHVVFAPLALASIGAYITYLIINQ